MNKMMILALLLTGSQAFAGASNILLSCASDSKLTKLEADIPGDFAEHHIIFTIDEAEIQWVDVDLEKDSSIAVRGSARKGTLAFDILEWNNVTEQTGQEKYLSFKTIKGSQKIERTESGERGTLQGTIQGFDPREDDPAPSPTIKLNCHYTKEL